MSYMLSLQYFKSVVVRGSSFKVNVPSDSRLSFQIAVWTLLRKALTSAGLIPSGAPPPPSRCKRCRPLGSSLMDLRSVGPAPWELESTETNLKNLHLEQDAAIIAGKNLDRILKHFAIDKSPSAPT